MRNSVMFWGVILVIMVLIIGGGAAAAVVVSTSDTQRGEELKAAQLPNNNTDLFKVYAYIIQIDPKMPEGETDLYYWNLTAERNLQAGECDENNKCLTSPCCSRWGFCGSGPAWCDCDGCIKYKPKTVQCGLINTKRIIGGSVVSHERKYPWHVGIRIPSKQAYHCGGSIINNRWILTAAHCVASKSSNTNKCVLYLNKSDVKVWVGDHHQYSTSDDDHLNTKIYDISAIKPHPKYDCTAPSSDGVNYVAYDMALLQLTDTISFNDIIRPICLPIDDSSYAGEIGKVTGWGYTSLTGPASEYLKELQVTIYDENQCGSLGSIPDIKICATGGICKGPYLMDSGGPLVVLENGKYIQVGVISHGNPFSCISKDYITVFVRVSEEIVWIGNIAGPYFSV